MNERRRALLLLSIVLLALPVLSTCSKTGRGRSAGPAIVAPDYLKGVIETIAGQFETENKIRVRVIYESFDRVLARAEESGAELVLIGDADRDEYRRGLDSMIGDGPSSCPFRLSLIAAGRPDGPSCADVRELVDDAFHRIVMVDTLQYEGRLAKEALDRARVWKKLKDKLILARTSLQLVSYLKTGEADAVLALEVSLREEKGWTILARLDTDRRIQKRLLHCAGVTVASSYPETARAFLDLFDSRLCPMYKLPGITRNTEE
ncbi:MAG: ABC transporter substrate-binding protein [candidate division Zixibacteria bacterium]|nr:ABC transporter substrate-binding protein [candidate division Zixibacteria bacterium]